VSSWVTALPKLKALGLTGEEFRVTAACSQLTELSLMTTGEGTVEFENGSLAGLRSLSVTDGIKALLPALTDATQLQSLDIFLNSKTPQLDTGGLGRLAGLTKLELMQCGLAVPPEGLSSLSALLDLDLSLNKDLGASSAASWEPLRAATQLTRLVLDYCDLKQLPPVVAQLPALQVSSGAGSFPGTIPSWAAPVGGKYMQPPTASIAALVAGCFLPWISRILAPLQPLFLWHGELWLG
jgi:Leucine-rich repeat (LRR) protein